MSNTSAAPLPTIPDPDEYRTWAHEKRLAHLLGFLEAHPEVHDQRIWVAHPNPDEWTPPTPSLDCGTTACAAGWTVLFAGATPTDFEVDDEDDDPDPTPRAELCTYADEQRHIPSLARELLGMSHWDHGMFDGENELAQLIERAQRTATGRRMIEAGLWEERRYLDD